MYVTLTRQDEYTTDPSFCVLSLFPSCLDKQTGMSTESLPLLSVNMCVFFICALDVCVLCGVEFMSVRVFVAVAAGLSLSMLYMWLYMCMRGCICVSVELNLSLSSSVLSVSVCVI